jgi:hypothetical protein
MKTLDFTRNIAKTNPRIVYLYMVPGVGLEPTKAFARGS